MAMDRGTANADVERALRQLSDTLEDAGIYVAADVDGDTISLSGEVDSQENRQAAVDVATAIGGPLGLRVDDGIEVMDTSPEDAFGGEDAVGTAADLRPLGTTAAIPEELLDPDFAGDPGTNDVMVAAAEAIPYFPPTDPVVRPVDNREELEVVGGFSDSAMDGLEGDASFDQRDDDDVRQEVERELERDALTIDLPIVVGVRNGVAFLRGEVPSLEDAENAEAVASRVGGVREVREELTVAGLARTRT